MKENNENLTKNLTTDIKTGKVKPRIERKSQRVVRKERKRIPLSSQKRLPTVNVPLGYVGRWFNDIDDRLYRAVTAGYDFLDNKTGKPLDDSEQRVQDVKNNDNGLISKQSGDIKSYFMIIEKKYWQEEQDRLEERNSLVDENIKNPTIEGVSKNETYHEVDINGNKSGGKVSGDMQSYINKAIQTGIQEALANRD